MERYDLSEMMPPLLIQRITPDGKAVLYTSDVSGYNQLYLVELPEDLNVLPLLSTVSQY